MPDSCSRAWNVAPIGALALLAACGDGSSRSEAGPTRRDSAGIAIVENAAPSWPSDRSWKLASEPTLDIVGGGSTDTDLSQVAAAARLADGRIVAVSTLSNVIRFYDPTGKLATSSGRKGSGPGEFQAAAGLWIAPGDSIVVGDQLLQRLSVLDAAGGGFGRNFSLGGHSSVTASGSGQVGIALPVGIFGDGTMLGMRIAFGMNQQREGTFRDSIEVIRYGRDGSVKDSLGRFPGIEMTQVPIKFGGQTISSPSPVPLGRQTVAAASGSEVFIAKNESWEIEVYDTTGAIRRVIRMAGPSTAITEADVAKHREEQITIMEDLPQLRSVPKTFKDQFLDHVRTAKYPATFGWIVALFPVGDGTLWVEEVVKPGVERRRFAVFDKAGAFLGRVDAPPKLRIMAIYPDAVVGIWRDADDVEHLRTHSVER